MLIETGHLNIRVSKRALMVVALGSVLSLPAWAKSAWAGTVSLPVAGADDTSSDQLSAEACTRSLPALEQAGYGAQTGHLQALKTLEACYVRLGLSDKANFARWQLYEDLDRGDPSDE